MKSSTSIRNKTLLLKLKNNIKKYCDANIFDFKISSDYQKKIGKIKVIFVDDENIEKLNRKKIEIYDNNILVNVTNINSNKFATDLFNGIYIIGEDQNLFNSSLRVVRSGYSFFSSQFRNFLTTSRENDLDIISRLSREETVLLLEVYYASNEKAIARRLGQPSDLIRQQLRLLYRKIDVSLSEDAKNFARRNLRNLHQRRLWFSGQSRRDCK